MTRPVFFAPEAEADLFRLQDYIAGHGGADRALALAYAERVVAYCIGFAEFPERGTRLDDLRPGLRTAGFEGRILIAFHLAADRIVIDRILYGGRDIEQMFCDD